MSSLSSIGCFLLVFCDFAEPKGFCLLGSVLLNGHLQISQRILVSPALALSWFRENSNITSGYVHSRYSPSINPLLVYSRIEHNMRRTRQDTARHFTIARHDRTSRPHVTTARHDFTSRLHAKNPQHELTTRPDKGHGYLRWLSSRSCYWNIEHLHRTPCIIL